MDRTSINSTGDITTSDPLKIQPVNHNPWQEHNWGTGGSIALSWGNHDGSTCTPGGTSSDATPDCLAITLGANPSVRDGDELMMNGVASATGVPIGWGGKIDTIAPTANAIKSSATKLIITFSETILDIQDDDDWSNNFSVDVGGDTTFLVDPVFDNNNSGGGTAAGDLHQDPKKFEITLDRNTSTTQVTVTNVTDEGGQSLASGLLSVNTDAVAPTICRVIRNDWDNNGQLNGGDEIVLIFDNENPADASNGCNTDVDYSSITNINTDFVIKRTGSPVANAFGQGANFWVDQWQDKAGELHINLRKGANIQAGDEIFAANGEVFNLAGNAMDDTSPQFTLNKVDGGEIEAIVYTDINTSSSLDANDTFVVHFNESIDPNTLGTYDGVAVTNLDWGLPLEHNFEANYGGGYTFVQKTWGANSAGAWNGDFTELMITLAAGSALGDYDLVQAFGVKTQNGGSIQKTGTIDLSAPVLKDVAGDSSMAGDPGTFDAGDMIVFIFNEPMNEASITKANLGIINGNFGDEASFNLMDQEGRVFNVTLGTTNLDIDVDQVGGDDTEFNPTNAVKDLNGNADNTPSALQVNLNMLTPVNNIQVSDTDTSNPGIDGRDLNISFDEDPGAVPSGILTYSLYLLPEFVSFDPAEQNPIAILNRGDTNICDGGNCSFAGTDALKVDIRSTNANGDLDDTKPYFPLNEFDHYVLYIIGKDNGSGETFPAQTQGSFQFSIEHGNDGQAPEVDGSMPWDGAQNISTNSKNFTIKFNEALNRETAETQGNIVLEKKSSDVWGNVPVYVSYNESEFSVSLEPVSDLDTNAPYRIRVTTNITDIGGQSMPSEFKTHFSTSGNSDSTAPKVQDAFFDGSTSTTDVPQNAYSIAIAFNEDMDPSKFTSSAVTLSPNIPGSEIQYDPFSRTMNYFLGGPLAADTEYTLTLSGLYIEDAAGNKLDGDGNGTATGTTSDNYSLTFTTISGALSTTKPTINWIDSRGKEVLIGFSDRMDKTAVEKKSNWTVKDDSDNRVDLQTGSFFYDGFQNELRIEGESYPRNELHD